MLLNPHRLSAGTATNRSAEVMAKTVEFFENRGKVALKRDEHDRVWPTDFLDFVRRERIFATLLTPAAVPTWGVAEPLLDEIFGVFVRDVNGHATDLLGKTSTATEQADPARVILRRPSVSVRGPRGGNGR
jgi:hypothetical protein